MTLNDLERRNGRVFCVILPNSVAFGAHYVKVVEDTPYILQAKCSPKNLVLAVYHVWQYSQEITPIEGVKMKQSSVASENLTYNQP